MEMAGISVYLYDCAVSDEPVGISIIFINQTEFPNTKVITK